MHEGFEMSIVPAEKKIPAGILAIVLGTLGIHKFYLGYTVEGAIMLVVTLASGWVTCGIGPLVVWAIAIAEGIIYLTKSDGDFYATYIAGRKGWL
ncbi:MAG: TM2 domain-containing protein [Fimbriimonas sp.]